MQAAGATDLVLFSTLEILVVVQVHQLAFGAVDDVCDCKSVEHDLMMVAMVVREEDAQAFFIVSGGEAFGISEVISGESFDGALDFGGYPAVGHSWRHDEVSNLKDNVSWVSGSCELFDAARHLSNTECHYIAMTCLID